MVLSEAAKKAAETILSKGERVELVPLKDGVRVYEIKRREIFQSTLPVRGATTRAGRIRRLGRISIHAPREGSDLFKLERGMVDWDFNPRSP